MLLPESRTDEDFRVGAKDLLKKAPQFCVESRSELLCLLSVIQISKLEAYALRHQS